MGSDGRREAPALAIATERMANGSTADVVLISMPFGPLPTPSIALGLLKSSLALRRISAKTLYFTLSFAEQIGTRLYRMAAHSTTATLAGEWIFASALFPQVRPDTEGYLHGVLEAPRSVFGSKVPGAQPEAATELHDLLEARGKVDRFLDDCLERVIDLPSPDRRLHQRLSPARRVAGPGETAQGTRAGHLHRHWRRQLRGRRWAPK